VRRVGYGVESRSSRKAISDETRGSSRMRCRSWCSRYPNRENRLRGSGAEHARRLALRLAPAKPAPFAGPYFCSTPPEAYFRPDRRTSRLPRAAAVKDGQHVEGEACSSLPGRSLRAASTAAHCGGSGPEGATRTAACHTDAVRGARQKSRYSLGSGGADGAHSSRKASVIGTS
jgi:hypothetical protein